MTTSRFVGTPEFACTVDLHDVDRPDDILRTADLFHARGTPATFFIPSAMFAEPRLARPLALLPQLGHEVASHGHLHDWREVRALMRGVRADLAFLAESHDRHAQFYGAAPTSFRAPRWCPLGPAAVAELARLGYVADSSATPQRFPLFSSTPYHPGWWSCSRRVHALAPGLAEIPTSTFLVPAGAPSFLTLRGPGSRLLLGLLQWEARHFGERPIVLQFHVEDFHPDGRRDHGLWRPSWSDLKLRAQGGFGFKYFFREMDPERIVRTHRAILDRFLHHRSLTITAIARGFLGIQARPVATRVPIDSSAPRSRPATEHGARGAGSS